MKLLLVLLFSPILPPPWPEINFTSCPRMSQPLDSSQRTWKYGQAERDKYAAVAQMLQEKKYSTAASAAAKFVTEYPDSDFHDPSLFLEMTALAFLDDRVGQARVAEQMVRFPLAEPVFRELGFVELAGTLSPYVFRDDPAKERKLTDLESWIRCAQEAESANVRTSSVSQDAFEKLRREPEGIMNRTTGFVALMRQQYDLADSKLQVAVRLNPQDALSYLWLFETKSLSPNPDLNSGIFYLAKWAELAPRAGDRAQSAIRPRT